MSQPAFINIHSHHKPLKTNEWVIRNAYAHAFKPGDPHYALSVGIHPWFVSQFSWDEAVESLRPLLAEPTVVAVGEIGLDRLKPHWAQQLHFFEKQLELATEYNKPVIIHCVKAYSDLLPFIKRKQVPFILHGFEGNATQATQLSKFAGVYFSFGPRQLRHAEKVTEVLRHIEPNRIFIETDTVRMPVENVYNALLPLLNMKATELQEQVIENFIAVFGSR